MQEAGNNNGERSGDMGEETWNRRAAVAWRGREEEERGEGKRKEGGSEAAGGGGQTQRESGNVE